METTMVCKACGVLGFIMDLRFRILGVWGLGLIMVT